MVESGGKLILVVDDDEIICRFCEFALNAAGHRVVIANSGMEALEFLKMTDFDLVISDINMPELDGVGLYFYILRDYPHLKDRFFFISRSLSDELRAVVSQHNKRCLVKPFKIDELIGFVNIVLAGNREKEEVTTIA